MYISEKYKEGIIYQESGMILVKIRCKATATDESIYETLKKIRPLVETKKPLYQVSTVFRNILDEAPKQEETTNPPETTNEDVTITMPKNEYIIENMVFTDEDIYGDNYDGEKRRYRIIWVDETGKEQFVPLEGIDTFEAVNPNGAYSYNSETKQLIFSAFMPYDTQYILRRYYYNE